MATQTFAFEIGQLMNFILNTLYPNKEIFLRELICNASDALSKLPCVGRAGIEIIPDSDHNTLTIRDQGIGMTKRDLIDNLGSIGKSSSKDFGGLPLIGKFGVGFYSAFLVADKVEVLSKHHADSAHVWSSEAGSSYTIRDATLNDGPIVSGTSIRLTLKADQKEYLKTRRLQDIIGKYCQFISYPIWLQVITEKDFEEVTAVDPDTGDYNINSYPCKPVKIKELRLVNMLKPLWTHDPKDINSMAYSMFYKSITYDFEDCLTFTHLIVDGQVPFKALLFVPKRAPYDFFETERKRDNIKLYVGPVLVTDDSRDIIPKYLDFVKGVVALEDATLNISREALQQPAILKAIKKKVTQKVLEMLADLTENIEDYRRFWQAFPKNLKRGIQEDLPNRQRLANLLRFSSTKSPDNWTSLNEYISRMKEGQTCIYYITGRSLAAVENAEFLEGLKRNRIEVLFLTDPIDEYVMLQLKDFEHKKFVCATKEGLDLEQAAESDDLAAFEHLCKKIKGILGDVIERVVLSSRLESSPCCLVTGEFGWSAGMESILKAQVLWDISMSNYMVSKKTFEINPRHPIISYLKVELELDAKNKRMADLVWLLFETSRLTSGFSLERPALFASRVYNLLTKLDFSFLEPEAEELEVLEDDDYWKEIYEQVD